MKKPSKFRFLKNKYVIIVLILVIGGIAYAATRSSGPSGIESATAAVGNVVEIVSVTGTVSPVSHADLAFSKSGTIATIAVKVGDSVKKGDLIASLDSDEDAAALASAQADLAELERGLRPQEIAADQSAVNAASTTLANAQKNALDAVRNGYVQVLSGVLNYSDTFFTNAESGDPKITVNTQSVAQQTSINTERATVSDVLSQWNAENNSSSPASAASAISDTEVYLATVKGFMSDLSAIINNLNTVNSGMSQSSINAALATMNTALSDVAQAITSVSAADAELTSATAGYAQAQNTFSLEEAGSSAETIAAQSAKVDQAQAELNDDQILSPIDGLITRADPNVGEFATAGVSGFSVESSGEYEIDAYVPEADIAKVALKDTASVTLDAYGDDVIFPAIVTAIDPAETVLEGVPTYKVTLMFVTPDARIRSGMTANTDILTHEVDNVLAIPARAVTDNNGNKTVSVLNADGKTFKTVPVTVGLKGSDGTIQVLSGLSAGQKVVTYAP